LKPTQSKVFGKQDIETIEEVVRDSRLVDKGINELKKFSHNAPSFDPDRRRFLKHAAMLAGLIATGQLLKGCATVQEPVQFQGKTYSNWEAYLMTQDLIRGPAPLYRPTGDLPYDNHLNRTGRYAIDYDVPIGTPLTPVNRGRIFRTVESRTGGNELSITHLVGREPLIGSVYAHLSERFYEKKETPAGPGTRGPSVDLINIVASSGNTGVGPGGGQQRPHLHFEISNREHYDTRVGVKFYRSVPPGLHPFTLGVDGGRPVYWDGETEIVSAIYKTIKIQEILYTFDARIKHLRDTLDSKTVKELLDRQNNPEELKNYVGFRVLNKKRGTDGKENYEFRPGSPMYKLMLELFFAMTKQEFIATLPFVYPELKPIYQKANPGIKF